MVIPSQGWYKVWANRLTFSKLEKNMCWNRFRWSIYQLLQDVDQQYIHVIRAFWFLRGVGCLKVNGQLVKSPFYIPYSSVCLVFICWWCFHFLSVSQSLSILQFSPNYPCECVFGKVKRFISRNWLYHPIMYHCTYLYVHVHPGSTTAWWPGWCRRCR